MAGVPAKYAAGDWNRCRSLEARQFGMTVGGRVARGRGLIIGGPTGTGKSTTAGLVCTEAVKQSLTIRWSYVPDLCDVMSLDPRARQEEIRRQRACDLLVWDDFGVRALGEREAGFLDQIVEARYRQRLPMVVTTNVPPQELREDPALRRMVDRWTEACDLVVIGGVSMRVAE